MKDTYVYPAVLTYDSDGISIEFPNLPGCLPCAQTEDEAIDNAHEALALHLYGMEQDQEEIPEPSKIQQIKLQDNQMVILVRVWMVSLRDKMITKSVNKMVTLPKWLIDLGDKHNVNYSQILQAALKDYLGVYDYRQLKNNHK